MFTPRLIKVIPLSVRFPSVLSKILTASAVILGSLFMLFASHSASQKICIKNKSIAFAEWKKSFIPSCDTNGSAEWSNETIKIVLTLNEHLESVNYIVPTTRFPVYLTDDISKLNISSHRAIIPVSLLGNTDVLAYAVLKRWVEDQNKNITRFQLLHETLTHFVFFSLNGREARLPESKATSAPVLWKSVQNNSHSNCVGDWKLTPKYQLCINRNYHFFETRTDFIKERLQTRFIQSWTNSYKRLSLSDQSDLLKFVLKRIKTYKVDDTILKEPSFSNYIKSMSSFWQFNDYFPAQNASKAMLASIIKDFNQINFVNIVDKSKFDLVIFKEGLKLNTISGNDSILKSLKKKESSLVAISNGDDFSIFPIRKTIKISSFSKWYSNQIVVESCKPLRMKEILKYTAYTEKLLLIYTCQPLSAEKIAQITRSGILGYAQTNSEEMFAHFHLPSLISKRDFIDPNIEVFQFLTQRTQKNSVYELFGWRELNWDQISKSYRPKAIVDAVNYFRVQL